MYIENKTDIEKKCQSKITFNFVEEGPGHGSEDITKECNVNCFDFFSFSVSLMDVMGGKITLNLKELHSNRTEETHVHRRRARSALSREKALELQ
jgi:hypothetical protein